MKMNEIERQAITVMEWSEPCVSLAAEAEEFLGYSLLKTEQESPKKNRSELELALAKAGIEILNFEHVKTYQAELLREKTTEMFNAWLKDVPVPDRMLFWGPGWEKTEIKKYRQPIPEFVLNKAIQIKKILPDVRIYIEHLSEHPDPFLVVAMKHESYDFDGETLYVEVWEEPRFEGRLR
jgi:hypothetical protein